MVLPHVAVVVPEIDADANFSGQITVPSAGTEVTGPAVLNDNGFLLIGHPDNTDVCWVMYSGQTKSDGYPISADRPLVLSARDLSDFDFDAGFSGEIICWIKI